MIGDRHQWLDTDNDRVAACAIWRRVRIFRRCRRRKSARGTEPIARPC